jgi:SAM-dependent methyltransferase
VELRPTSGADDATASETVDPPPPWTVEYVERQHAFIDRVLGDPAAVELFAADGSLPSGYGVGLDERVVEYPWLSAAQPRGRALDAGSTLNHAHILDRFLPTLDSLTMVTLSPEPGSFPERGVTYVYADLRELPFERGCFDVVISLSTLEHVGMDNSVYTPGAGRAADPDAELGRAVRELRRVLIAGGRVLISVPYGRPEDHGWFRQLGRSDVERLMEAFEPVEHEVLVWLYTREGWRRSDLQEASSASYRPFYADRTPVEDLAAAARAVACISMRA